MAQCLLRIRVQIPAATKQVRYPTHTCKPSSEGHRGLLAASQAMKMQAPGLEGRDSVLKEQWRVTEDTWYPPLASTRVHRLPPTHASIHRCICPCMRA